MLRRLRIQARLWLAFGMLTYVGEFFNYHPVAGFLNRPLIQVPCVNYIPAHLEEAATKSGFMAPNSRLRERWRRLFSRVPAFEREEVNILRGLLKALLHERKE